ncbi:MAG: RHS repeat-associated core domain-containing protein, partial [Thermodesulfovibrionales bacterium]
PEGDTITYGYDTANRLTQISEGNQTFGFTYDTAGRRTKLSRPNGTYTGYSYDADSRPATIAHRNPANSLLDRFIYAYDPVSNITAKTDLTGKHAYTYDKLSQLRKTVPPAADTTESPENYTYDPVGNRLTGAGATDASTYSPGNLLASDSGASYSYNSNGNLIRKTGGGTTAQYFYDYENRLIKATITGGKVLTFRYDPFGRRIAKKVAITKAGTTTTTLHEYLYDNEDIILEYQSVNGGAKETTKYLHGPGIDEPLAMERGGHTYYYHADHLGSIVALTDEAGAVVQKYDYDSYGNLDPGTTTIKQPYTYTGREWDSETGLSYYRARYYDAKAGRFISKDPIGFAGGDANLYRYVENNPIKWVDPLGLVKGVHYDYTKTGERVIHYDKYRFNREGELVEHCGKKIKDVPREARRMLDWLRNVKPDFFRTMPLLILLPGQTGMMNNLNNGLPLNFGGYD